MAKNKTSPKKVTLNKDGTPRKQRTTKAEMLAKKGGFNPDLTKEDISELERIGKVMTLTPREIVTSIIRRKLDAKKTAPLLERIASVLDMTVDDVNRQIVENIIKANSPEKPAESASKTEPEAEKQ